MQNFNFDPAAFLEMPVEVALERRPPLPAGDYPSQIQEVKARQWQSKDKYNEDGTLKAGIAYDITHVVQVPLDVKERVGLSSDTMTLKDSIMLDLNAQGGLDTAPGKNGGLRRYREALDMNKPGVAFRATDMAGKMLLVRVKHEEYQGNIQERIDGVARLP